MIINNNNNSVDDNFFFRFKFKFNFHTIPSQPPFPVGIAGTFLA